MDQSSDPLSAKIKAAQLEKIPWMIVIGNKEVEHNVVTLRHSDGRQEQGVSVEKLVQDAQKLNA